MEISRRDKSAAKTFSSNADSDPKDGYGISDAALKRLSKLGLAKLQSDGSYKPTSLLEEMIEEWEVEAEMRFDPSFC